MTYYVTKTYGHEAGLSCAFRQWRAESHCRFLHGYALAFKFTFAAEQLDERNWVLDFGSLKSLKTILEHWFDHTTVIALDDPEHFYFSELYCQKIIELRQLPDVGCEAFAAFMGDQAIKWLELYRHAPRVTLHSVEVREHGANSAIWMP